MSSSASRTPGSESCLLCGEPGGEAVLYFRNNRNPKGFRTELGAVLCEGCGDRMEKHLKRAIPKSKMVFTPA